MVEVVLAPAAMLTDAGLMVDVSKLVLLLSVGARLNVVAEQPPVSLLVMVISYVVVQPSIVIVLETGVSTTEGAYLLQTFRVVATVFDTPLGYPPDVEVIEVFVRPVACPGALVTVSVLVSVWSEPRVTDASEFVENFRLSEFVTARANVAGEQSSLSLLVKVTV